MINNAYQVMTSQGKNKVELMVQAIPHQNVLEEVLKLA
jgi:hypothetical protein